MRIAWSLFVCALVAGCSGPEGPPINVSGLEIFAPLPGSNAGVAYFSVENNTDATIVVRRVDSPQFERVELHESLLEDGVYRMNALDALTVDSRRAVTLRAGGKHLMLMSPRADLAVGQPVTLILHYDTDGEIVLRATLQSRVQLDED